MDCRPYPWYIDGASPTHHDRRSHWVTPAQRGGVDVLMRRRIDSALTPLQKFSVVTFLCVLAVTIVACGLAGHLLVQHLVAQDAALAGDLARLLLTRSLPASLFVPTAVPDPTRYAETIKDIAASAEVVRVVLYDARAPPSGRRG